MPGAKQPKQSGETDHKSEVIIFMRNQDKINESLLESIKSIDQSLSRSEALQVEVNNLTSRVTKSEHSIESALKETSEISKLVAVNTSITDQQKEMKKLLMGGVVTLGVAFIITISSGVFMKDESNDEEYKKAVIELIKNRKD